MLREASAEKGTDSFAIGIGKDAELDVDNGASVTGRKDKIRERASKNFVLHSNIRANVSAAY
jgi:hypothetical protein